MSDKKKSYPKPTWMHDVNPRWINADTKELYAYFCVFGPNTCWQWNCRLMKRFFVSRRTIKRRLKKLQDYALITIENPGTIHRKIHPVYYPDVQAWLRAAWAKKLPDLIGKIGSPRKKTWAKSGPQEVKSTHYVRTPHNGRASKLARLVYNDRSDAAGLGGSRGWIPKTEQEKKLFDFWFSEFLRMGYDLKKSRGLTRRQAELHKLPPG